MAYPLNKDLQSLSQNMTGGNFGLWYNKFIPIKDFNSCKPSDSKGDDNNAVNHYADTYKIVNKTTLKEFLAQKHLDHVSFCESFSSNYEKVVVTAKLKTPLVTGIGETHPHEISMVFDHNLGIPYIPASGIKGIVRFAHTLGLLFDENGNFTQRFVDEKDGYESINEDNEETFIPKIFGNQGKRGSVIFLDAYTETVPELHIDIMNPHYGKYYSESNVPPADYLDPNPLKFITVAKGTVFVFRALVDKKHAELVAKVKEAFKKALTEEGVGAKTAIGYGLFEVTREAEPESINKIIQAEKDAEEQKAKELKAQEELQRIANLTEDEKLINEIEKLTKDPNQIAPLVKKCLDGSFKKDVYVALKKKLDEIGEWKPDGAKKRKEKMQERNQKIEAKIESCA